MKNSHSFSCKTFSNLFLDSIGGASTGVSISDHECRFVSQLKYLEVTCGPCLVLNIDPTVIDKQRKLYLYNTDDIYISRWAPYVDF